MGRKIQFNRVLTGLFTLTASLVAPAFAQDAPILSNQTIDMNSLRLAAPADETQTANIDFENVQGPVSGAGIVLTNQYERSHNVTFGAGNSVHFCRRITDDVNASLCPYSQAASGARAAAHEVRSGVPAMTMTFSRPVDQVSMHINPTGGLLGEAFVATLIGFDASGEQIAVNTLRFSYEENSIAWPTVVALRSEVQSFTSVSVQLSRESQNNQAVRFLIDDLQLTYGAEFGDAPVLAALNNARVPPRIEGAEIVQSPETESVRDELRLYPAATRIRTVIDWDAVQETLDAQAAIGMSAVNHGSGVIVDRAALPVLLPSVADANSLTIQSNRDSYHADFEIGGRGYSLYGTRILTVINTAEGAPAPTRNVKPIETDYAFVAGFSLYGASYTLTRYCRNDHVDEDPACHNSAEFGEVAKDMVVVVGAAGRERP